MTTQTNKIKPGKLNSKHLQAAFDVGHVTVNNWRKGGGRKEALPFIETHEGAAKRITFDEKAVTRWAKANSVAIVKPFDKVLEEQSATNAKPGPKVTAPQAKPSEAKQTKSKPAVAAKAPAKKVAKKVTMPAKKPVATRNKLAAHVAAAA